jgi:hypothetical protein
MNWINSTNLHKCRRFRCSRRKATCCNEGWTTAWVAAGDEAVGIGQRDHPQTSEKPYRRRCGTHTTMKKGKFYDFIECK